MGNVGLWREDLALLKKLAENWSPKPSVTCLLSSGSRQLALKALNERLKRVEDQSAWPSMDDDEEGAGAQTDSPLPSEQASTPAGMGTVPESSLITLEAAPLL